APCPEVATAPAIARRTAMRDAVEAIGVVRWVGIGQVARYRGLVAPFLLTVAPLGRVIVAVSVHFAPLARCRSPLVRAAQPRWPGCGSPCRAALTSSALSPRGRAGAVRRPVRRRSRRRSLRWVSAGSLFCLSEQ